jgi:hypothetical protein
MLPAQGRQEKMTVRFRGPPNVGRWLPLGELPNCRIRVQSAAGAVATEKSGECRFFFVGALEKSMKRMLYGAAALAAIAVAPGVASAQYYGYYAPQPYYGAPVYQAYPAAPYYATGYPVYNVPPGYMAPSMAPSVDWGQASASSHGTTVWGTSNTYPGY